MHRRSNRTPSVSHVGVWSMLTRIGSPTKINIASAAATHTPLPQRVIFDRLTLSEACPLL